MNKLTHENLYSLEEYSRIREEFRAKVMAHKKDRRVAIGDHAALYFEDQFTMQYQVQEMLRAERIFEAEGINEELEAYNPLIPDGANLKATMMIQYPDVAERQRRLAELVGVEQKVWMQVEGFAAVSPICDEDLERDTDEKTSSVHFMRFEFAPEMITALREGAKLSAGVDHAKLQVTQAPVVDSLAAALLADFD